MSSDSCVSDPLEMLSYTEGAIGQHHGGGYREVIQEKRQQAVRDDLRRAWNESIDIRLEQFSIPIGRHVGKLLRGCRL